MYFWTRQRTPTNPGSSLSRETTGHSHAKRRRLVPASGGRSPQDGQGYGRGRYLRQMDLFSRRDLHSLGDLLSTTPQSISDAKLSQLAQHVDDLQRRYGVSTERP